MPPAHRPRHSSGPATKGSQKTLSFSNSKVTKPNTILSAKGISKSSASPIIKIDTSLLEKEAQLSHVDSTAAVTEQARVELAKPKVARSPEELKAEKITDAQILKYWKEQQAERRTKRVHQEDLDINERVLRLFDISSQYGVCGLSSCRILCTLP
jgi:DNA polymerase delta subunit 4